MLQLIYHSPQDVEEIPPATNYGDNIKYIHRINQLKNQARFRAAGASRLAAETKRHFFWQCQKLMA
jgi:hypothetical protein